MDVSVVICTHNRSSVLQGALDALAVQQADGLTWEIVVVDNASTDDTFSVVDSFRARSAIPVRYELEPVLGHSRSLNRAIAASAGAIVAFTDDDARPERDWLHQVYGGFARHGADWVFGRVLPEWEGVKPSWFSDRFMGYFALLDFGPDSFVVTDKRQSFYGVNCATRRDVLERLGGYREDYGPKGKFWGVGADTDLFERSLAAGLRIVYVPEAVVQHVIPASRGSKRHQREKVWRGAEGYHAFLREGVTDVPWLFGLPRYFYRKMIDDLLIYAGSVLRGDRSGAFYAELQLIRFVGLSYQAVRHRSAAGQPARVLR
jgi:glycosyltransferase involved in cell wall biosynthesis